MVCGWRKTVVVFVSDHGEALDELIRVYGFGFGHGGFLYPFLTRIPMILRFPGEEGFPFVKDINIPVSIVDVMPTVLEFLGIDPGLRLSGASLFPLIRGETSSHEPVICQRRFYDDPPKPYLRGLDFSVIEGSWYLIHMAYREDSLYNMAEEVEERRNLINEHPKAEKFVKILSRRFNHRKPLFDPSKFESNREALDRLHALGYVD
ncbi:MAG: sulfatase-like hydrolase/transferase [Planctomycetes bacterium]|nr:sulfatase-like hydrolase/transferase [Planctomycetota bacterium]